MKALGFVLSLVFSVLFGLLALSMFLTRNFLSAIAMTGAILVLVVPYTALARRLPQKMLWLPVRIFSVVVLVILFILPHVTKKQTTIYASPEVEQKMMDIYDERLAQWPTPYESVLLDTRYGAVHVIVSGPEDAPPLLLLHASGLAGWSWLYNVGELNKYYRTYAVDTIGDAGRSVLTDIGDHPRNAQDYADFYTEITDQLGIPFTDIVGASEGGFIASSYAIHAPERVGKVALLGPMGYAGTTESVVRITLAALFPIRPVQDVTVKWALGDDPDMLADVEEWFRTLMAGTQPKKATPVPFTPEELASIESPVLLVLGEKDNLVGEPARAEELARHIPDLEVFVIPAGHAMGLEAPETVNQLLCDFLGCTP